MPSPGLQFIGRFLKNLGGNIAKESKEHRQKEKKVTPPAQHFKPLYAQPLPLGAG
jgi:hypothetical protein